MPKDKKPPESTTRDFMITYSFIDGSAVHFGNAIVAWHKLTFILVDGWLHAMKDECELRKQRFLAIMSVRELER